MPAKPKTPPSYAQATDRPPFIEGLKMLSKNGHFWILFTVHGINVGLSIALATIFNQVITPYGYTNAQSGQLSAVSFFAGTLGCCKYNVSMSTVKPCFWANLHSTVSCGWPCLGYDQAT